MAQANLAYQVIPSLKIEDCPSNPSHQQPFPALLRTASHIFHRHRHKGSLCVDIKS